MPLVQARMLEFSCPEIISQFGEQTDGQKQKSRSTRLRRPALNRTNTGGAAGNRTPDLFDANVNESTFDLQR